ncbi:hypothetical protein CLV52_1182 [Amnibacterium kyonggiense]|uniref:Uncharacterized protein n=1 Tax=Amnibacterium kyonggiense TaxID=595671 RepID=A0A4R7FS67_9MICO|nr:hypothetical protein CLV52_1182 [Amnibacterium kyonggiense]
MAETRDERLRAAREAAFRRDASAEDRARLAALEQDDAPAEAAAPRAPAEPPERPEPPRRWGAIGAVAVAALVVGALLGGTAVSLARPTAAATVTPAPERPGAELRARVLASNGTWSAQDYYRFYPGQLPSEWSGDTDGRSYVQLSGPRRLRLSIADATGALLVVPTCATSEGRSRWTVRAADGRALGSGAGPCGGFDGGSLRIPAGARPLVLEISTQGTAGYAVSIFER